MPFKTVYLGDIAVPSLLYLDMERIYTTQQLSMAEKEAFRNMSDR